MAATDFSEIIKRIHNSEQEAIGKIKPPNLSLIGTPQNRFNAISEFARPFLTTGVRTCEEGTTVEWAQYPYAPNGEVKLPHVLLMTPAVIIDVMSHPEEDFISTFGVTPSQMKKLAKAGFVIPNIAYDSEVIDGEGSLFSAQRIKNDSLYAQRPFIVDLLADEDVPVTINGLRRKHLFGSLGFPVAAQKERTDLFARRLRAAFSKEGAGVLKHGLSGMPVGSPESLVQKLAHNLMYLDFFSDLFESEADREFVDLFERSPTKFSPRSLIELISFRKADMCAQITATFGGAQSATLSQMERIHRARYAIHSLKNPEPSVTSARATVHDNDLAFAQLMMKASEMRRGLQISSWSQQFPIRDEAVFDGFVDFLTRVNRKRQEMERLKDAMMECVTELQLSHTLKQYEQILDDVLHEGQANSNLLGKFGAEVIVGGIGYAAADKIEQTNKIAEVVEGIWPHQGTKRTFLKLACGGAAAGLAFGSGEAASHALGQQVDWTKPEAQGKRRIIAETARSLVYG